MRVEWSGRGLLLGLRRGGGWVGGGSRRRVGVDWWENNLERVGQKSEEVASCGGGSYAPFISNDMK